MRKDFSTFPHEVYVKLYLNDGSSFMGYSDGTYFWSIYEYRVVPHHKVIGWDYINPEPSREIPLLRE